MVFKIICIEEQKVKSKQNNLKVRKIWWGCIDGGWFTKINQPFFHVMSDDTLLYFLFIEELLFLIYIYIDIDIYI